MVAMRSHRLWDSGKALDGAAIRAHRIIYSLLTIALTALILGASPPPARADGQLSVEPSAVYFGSVWVGRTHSIRVTVTNSGNAATTISGVTLGGSGYSESGLALPKTLSAGAEVTFEIRFSPTTAGAVSGELRLVSNAINSTVVIPLYGDGVTREAAGYASADPLSAQFGNVPVGTTNTEMIEITNTGERSLSITSVRVNGSAFSVSGITTPISVGAGKRVQFSVGFLPKSVGVFSGSVNVQSTATDSQLTIVLSGTGVGSSQELDVTPASIAFGNVDLNGSATQQITLKNAGNSNISISGDSVKGAGLTVTGVAGGTSLAPGQTAAMTAEFAPTAAGSITGSITISSNATNGSVTVPVTGTGVAATHAADLQWLASTSNGVIGYDVYRSTVSGGS
jgi:Abnormal spindle-like microcephaly-assoc'd, ASPM-SPD-2-Hydin/CARDB